MRFRNRVETLEQQNKELQEEVKLLEQYRLQCWHQQEAAKVMEEQEPRKTLQRKTTNAVEEGTVSPVWLP